MSLDVLSAGELYIDLIMGGFDSYPQPGQETFARDFRREAGGGAAITACGLARLGTRTGLLAIAGADYHAWIAARLGEFGVEAGAVALDPIEPTGFTVAVTSPRDRTFFTYLGANRKFAAVIDAAPLDGVRHVHLAWAPPWDVAAALIERIHRAGATVSLDAGGHPRWLRDPRALDVLRAVDLFFPNETEAAWVTGETDAAGMLRRFADAGLPGVVLKLGSLGARLLLNGAIYEASPHRVSPVDTTGAGDCFDAGFLHAWLRGESPERCLAVANICGALSTEVYGGIAGFPSRDRVLQELSS
ncbi:MAG TPA: carbohydrate kinase family protein [Candidatus Acidoferrum sp.]|jgi:sugar/nucleoside kinase (ribokinase family)|nr:carbohydrate kinase family protein [Candidatus Acidoferrum sp.]